MFSTGCGAGQSSAKQAMGPRGARIRTSATSARSQPVPEPQHMQQPTAQHACEQRMPLGRRHALLSAVAVASTAVLASPATAAPQPIKPFCGVTDVNPMWAYSADWQESTFAYAGCKTWVRALGQLPPKKPRARGGKPAPPPQLPLVVVHGGPGSGSRQMESVELLGSTNRRLVFYDQAGCGRSLRASGGKAPSNPSLDLYVQEIEALAAAQDLGTAFHLLAGPGWGGILALSYARAAAAAGRPPASLTLISTPASYADLVADRRTKAVELLGEEMADSLLQGPPGPSTSAEQAAAYKASLRAYEQRYVVTRAPTPGCVLVGSANASVSTTSAISTALCGPSPFEVGGELAFWDARPWLGSLSGIPTLVVRGTAGELSPTSTRALVEGLGSEAQLLECEGAGSFAHIDAAQAVLDRVDAHLMIVDARRA